MARKATNTDAVSVDEIVTSTDVPRWKAIRIITALQHESELKAGMAYSSYDHRHEAPDTIGVFRSGKAISL